MEKRLLIQIKTFRLDSYRDSAELDEAVNNFVIAIFNKENNYPSIETNSFYVTVKYNALLQVKE